MLLPMWALALGGCAFKVEPYREQDVIKAEANIYPTNYKPEILAFLRSYLNDPTGIRGASIADPDLKPVASDKRYVVCLRFNAKKSGQYEGSKDRVAFFLAGKFDTLIDDKQELCANANFHPFPELERLTR